MPNGDSEQIGGPPNRWIGWNNFCCLFAWKTIVVVLDLSPPLAVLDLSLPMVVLLLPLLRVVGDGMLIFFNKADSLLPYGDTFNLPNRSQTLSIVILCCSFFSCSNATLPTPNASVDTLITLPWPPVTTWFEVVLFGSIFSFDGPPRPSTLWCQF